MVLTHFGSYNSLDSVMKNNGFYKDEVEGFQYYVKDVKSVNNNIHKLTWVEMVPFKSTEDIGGIIDEVEYDIGIKVECNNTGYSQTNPNPNKRSYYILSNIIENEKEHCEVCNRYIGEKLVQIFNEKDGVVLPDINTNYDKVHLYCTILGFISLFYIITYLVLFMYSIYINFRQRVYNRVEVINNLWYRVNMIVLMALIPTIVVCFIQMYLGNLR